MQALQWRIIYRRLFLTFRREVFWSSVAKATTEAMASALPSENADFGGPVVRADATVTFTAPKIGQLLAPAADCVGKLVVRSIGTPRDLLDDDATLKIHWLEPGEFRSLPMVRKADANK